MSIAEKIETIVETEHRARAILDAAETEAGRIRLEAREAARLTEEAAGADTRSRSEELRAEARREWDRRIAEINTEADAKATGLKRAAKPRLAAAADLVYDRVIGGA